MIYSGRFTVILDACVLYPAPLRDILLSCAQQGLYKPKWTEAIQDEWQRNLLKNRPDLRKHQLVSTSKAMSAAFPEALVVHYEKLIAALSLPDPDDTHVLAAAIRTNADLIVTFNLKDFPHDIVAEFDIEVQHPDVFLTNLFELNPEKSVIAFQEQVKRLRNPPKPAPEVLEILARQGLHSFVAKLKNALYNF